MIQLLSGPTPEMNGNIVQSFVIRLTGNARVNVTHLKPGYTYNVKVEQDATGGWTLTWLQNIRNPMEINPSPEGVTMMGFICLDDGVGYASRGGTWS